MFYKKFMSIMGNEPLINIEELDHIRQSNQRDSQYQLKRLGENKFIISNKAKAIIGHDATKGIDLRAGNGSVLIATRPKEDKRCTRGLLNGSIGKTFTSSRLEEEIESNLPKDTFYDLEFAQEYQDGKYFKLVPSDSADDTETDEPQQAEETPAPEVQQDDAEAEHAEGVPAEAAPEVAPVNDDF